MSSCPNSPWVVRANAFLNANRNNPDGRFYTIEFLINNNHCGEANGTSIQNILPYLQTHGISLTVNAFQQRILGELKRMGIVSTLVYPGRGRQGGVFIPCNQNEVRYAAEQMLKRVESEISNFENLVGSTTFPNLINAVNSILEAIRVYHQHP